MFNLREFIKGGLLKAVGKMNDHQVILNAAGWYEKGVLTEDDLADIQHSIDVKNTPLVARKKAEQEAEEAMTPDGEDE